MIACVRCRVRANSRAGSAINRWRGPRGAGQGAHGTGETGGELLVGGADIVGGHRRQILRGRGIAQPGRAYVPRRTRLLIDRAGEPAVAELVDPAAAAHPLEDPREVVEGG